MRRAKMCTTARALDWLPNPSREQQLAPTFSESTALVRGLSNSAATLPDPESPSYRVPQRHARPRASPISRPSSWRKEQYLASLPRSAALLCGLSKSNSTRSRPRRPFLLSFAARRNVHDRSRSCLAHHLLESRAAYREISSECRTHPRP
jgi:hypothetical protein